MSDKWASYQCLKENGFVHYSVNHSENFVDPMDSKIHTLNVESRWNAIKRKLKRKGTNVTKFLDEYLLKFKYNIFDRVVNRNISE